MSCDFAEEDLCKLNRKAFKSCLCVCFGIPSKGRVKCLYIREGVNPSSMDGVPDLRDQMNFDIYLAQLDIWDWILI